MSYIRNILYLLALLVLFLRLLYKALTTGKYRRGLWRKLTGRAYLRTGKAPCVWFHGVSVGEIHLLRQVVAAFRWRHPDWDCVISTTTDTGFEEARKRVADLPVFFWPLDFTWAVKRALRRVRPTLVVLAEGEIWPNFLVAAKRFGARVAIINGRMSPRSFRRYRALPFFVRGLFRKLDLCAAQTQEYAENFCCLGARPSAVHVTGSVKFDGVETNRNNPKTRELSRLLAIGAGDLVWIAGSTQAPEEKVVLEIYKGLRTAFPKLRLILVPRQKDRFDEVASLLEASGVYFVRRSAISTQFAVPSTPYGVQSSQDSALSTQHSARGTHDSVLGTQYSILGTQPPVILVDTIGELSALWGLADVAYVGGSLDGKRGGQNMIEPAAYRAAVVFGPHVWNFREIARQLVESGAAIQVEDAAGLETVIKSLLENPARRDLLGKSAAEFVLRQQGATELTLDLLDRHLLKSHRAGKVA